MEPPNRVCPRCREEYRRGVERCADCDVALVDAGAILDAAPEELPPASELAPIRAASVAWLRGLSDLLSDAGVAHRIDAPPREGTTVSRRSHERVVALYVRPEDRERALELDARYLRSQIPELGDHSDAPVEVEGCPACGAAVDAAAGECPECGLCFGEAG